MVWIDCDPEHIKGDCIPVEVHKAEERRQQREIGMTNRIMELEELHLADEQTIRNMEKRIALLEHQLANLRFCDRHKNYEPQGCPVCMDIAKCLEISRLRNGL